MNFLSELFGRTCFLCGKSLKFSEKRVCKNCINSIMNFSGYFNCRYCGRSLERDYFPDRPGYICGICKGKRFPYKELFVYAPYQGILKDLLISYKFRDQFWVADLIVGLLSEDSGFQDFIDDREVILPVPLNDSRLNQRGFNQVYLIAKKLNKKLGKKRIISNHDLIRIKNTDFQKNLSQKKREVNIRGAFALKNRNKLLNRKILVFDDIYTTGSTIMEVCRTLKRGGIRDIKALVIAR